MKILHLSNVLGELNGGGVHEVVSNLYRCQKEQDHEPHIWYPGESRDADSIRLDENIRHLDTVGPQKYGLPRDLFRSSRADFDIIHQHGIWKPMSIYAKSLSRKSHVRRVVQPHGYLEPFRLNISKNMKRLAFSLYERENIRNSQVL